MSQNNGFGQIQTEMDLEDSGQIYSLQSYRWDQRVEANDPDMDRLLCIELSLRQNTQREIALREERQRLLDNNKQGSLFQRARLRLLNDKIRKSLKAHWSLERLWWQKRSSFEDGPLTRAIDYWRSQPQWYMHKVLVEDCAGMGGCCARA
jgi:hypothetical protein